jgi:excinuclease ABC subunit C
LKDLITYIKTIPEKPGIYKYFSKEGKIIYVGKAKNLKKRVHSYFQKTFENNKTAVLVKQITKIEYLVVDTELDALLLENNLIKQYRPKYNILLKDDKTFPWIGIKNEAFPRVISTRKKENDGTLYFGPYANVKMMNTLLKLIKETYPLRSCNFDLRQKNIQENKFKVCLDYHIGKCKGPCVGYQTEENYLESIHQITLLLKGKTNALLQELKNKMQESSKELAFEKAQEYKEIYEQLLQYKSKSMVVSNHVLDLDVISLIEDERSFFINYLVVSEGAIIHGYSSEIIKKLEESAADVLAFTLPELRERYQSQNKEVLTSHPLIIDFQSFESHVPQKGDKFKLLELSIKNSNYFRLDQRKKESLVAPERHTQRILEQIKKDFHLTDLPHHIECFDNSNFQGTNAVAACVVFKDAKPFKKEYRHFLIKTVDGPDDFASMKEIIFRRYKRLKEENLPFPQLVVIDGGKGQLSAAMESIDALGLRGSFAVVGIAKKLEEIFFPGDSYPLYIDKKSESLKVIQHIRNEAHRFGITHHRDLRSKNAIHSSLLDIPGIGEKTMTQLFQEFKTIKAINSAELMALEKCIGPAKALIVRKALDATT